MPCELFCLKPSMFWEICKKTTTLDLLGGIIVSPEQSSVDTMVLALSRRRRDFLVNALPAAVLGSSSNLAWRCIMVKRRRRFWCERSHRCHGNNIFCGNILEPVTSAVFTRLSWNLAHRTNITWHCEKLNFRNCYAERCHGNHTYQEK